MSLILAYAIGGFMSTLGAFLAGNLYFGKDVLAGRKQTRQYANELVFNSEKDKKDFIKAQDKKFNHQIINIWF